MGEIGGDIEIQCQVAIDPHLVGSSGGGGLVEVPAEGTTAVGGVDHVGGREGHHVRTVPAGVGDEGDDTARGHVEEPLGTWQVGVADDDLAHASLRFTIGRFTTEEEVDFAAQRLAEVVTRLRAAR